MLLGQLLLLLASLGLAYVGKAQLNRGTHQQENFLVILLSALAVGVALLGQLTLDPEGSDSGTLARMLNNLAIYAGAPMLVTAVAAIAKNYPISRPAWGRWLLGLFALFELCRRMEYGEGYTLVLAICCLAGLLASLLWLNSRAFALPIFATVVVMASAVFSYYQLSTVLALVLSSVGVLLLTLALRNVQPQLQPE